MAENKALKFKIGDWIIHYYYGPGKVMDILEKDLDGSRETFFKVSTETIEYWLQSDKVNADHIQPLRSKEDFNQALEIIAQAPEPLLEPSNRSKRLIYERWLDGSLPARAALIRDLHGRNHVKDLSYDEKETYDKAAKFFINEWIIAIPSLTKEGAREKLREALQISIQQTKLETDPVR